MNQLGRARQRSELETILKVVNRPEKTQSYVDTKPYVQLIIRTHFRVYNSAKLFSLHRVIKKLQNNLDSKKFICKRRIWLEISQNFF